MTRSRIRRVALAISLTTLAVVGGCVLTQQQLPPDAGSSCATSLTAAEFNTWFESGAVSLNGAVKPADSVNFPNVPNCSFYKWSEQMFLWLTSPAPPKYGSGGLVMNTSAFYDVSLPDASGERHFVPHTPDLIRAFNLRTPPKGILDLPVVLEKKTGRLLEIIPPVLGPTGRQIVVDGNGDEVEVAGARVVNGETPVLLDAQGRAIKGPKATLRSKRDESKKTFERKLDRLTEFDRRELVQKFVFDKSVILLDLSGAFTEPEQGQADGGVLMAQNGSLVYYAIIVNNVFALYRTMQGASVPSGTKFPVTQADLDAITTFAAAHGKAPVIDSEALAIEIKSSWVEAAGLIDADKFIQMKAIVPTYDKSNPNEWVPNGTKTVMLAMTGMHVVGSTKGHPELLWGTFEHVSNCPVATYDFAKSPSGTGTVPQNTTGTWVYCSNGSAGPFNQMRMFMSGDHIVANSPLTIGPSNVLRLMPWGLPGSSASQNAEVISINNTVRSLLDPADVRKNYIHEGTTWTIGGAAPSAGNQVGTNKLENATLETFFQGNNCFTCHSTNTTAVSHVFDETHPLF